MARKFKGFFRPKLGDLQKKKKKKGLRQNPGRFFFQFRKFKRLRGGSFGMGGLFSIFHRKSASKAQKTCDFAYFTSQWGGSSPPRPPLATLLSVSKDHHRNHLQFEKDLAWQRVPWRYNTQAHIQENRTIFYSQTLWTRKVSSVPKASWIGSASQQLEHEIKSAVQNCYGAVSPRLIFSSQCMLLASKKDVLPANQRSMVIFEYVCHCDSRYVGRTTQRLRERIKQHVPKAIKQKTTLTQEHGTYRSQPTRTQPNRKCKAKSKTQFEPDSDLATGQHLLESNQCARNYSDSRFKILTTARSQVSLEPVESGLYFTEKNRFVQAKAVRIHSTTVSVRSKLAIIG